MNVEYLNWLYFSNPLGDVVGFDAMEGNAVVSHYACIPTSIDGVIGLLSVNTSTHPDFRSQGLYKKLAKKTYETWNSDFNFVVGVANAQSSGIFVNHLGFKEVGSLNLRYGDLRRPQNGSRTWSNVELDWRVDSPRQRFRKEVISRNSVELSIRPKGIPLVIKSIVSISDASKNEIDESGDLGRFGFTVDWIRDSKPNLDLPGWLKPSPLVLIFQSLSNTKVDLNSWSFSDFDVF
jgi:hypothetical protein